MDLQNRTDTGLRTQGGLSYGFPGANLTGAARKLAWVAGYPSGREKNEKQSEILSVGITSTTALPSTTATTESSSAWLSIMEKNDSLLYMLILCSVLLSALTAVHLYLTYTGVLWKNSNSKEAKRRKTYRRVIILLMAAISFISIPFVKMPAPKGVPDDEIFGILCYITFYNEVICALATTSFAVSWMENIAPASGRLPLRNRK